MQDTDNGQRLDLDGAPWRIGLVQARFNEKVTQALAKICKEELLRLGVQATNIAHITVPGALEIPAALQVLARRKQCDALIALGCVIRGETYHFELVSNECAAGVSRVALDHHISVVNAVLTVEDQDQAWARTQPVGVGSARVAIEMAHLLKEIL
jgi:6,7-dimethyl-8-ribityllumazine synthase